MPPKTVKTPATPNESSGSPVASSRRTFRSPPGVSPGAHVPAMTMVPPGSTATDRTSVNSPNSRTPSWPNPVSSEPSRSSRKATGSMPAPRLRLPMPTILPSDCTSRSTTMTVAEIRRRKPRVKRSGVREANGKPVCRVIHARIEVGTTLPPARMMPFSCAATENAGPGKPGRTSRPTSPKPGSRSPVAASVTGDAMANASAAGAARSTLRNAAETGRFMNVLAAVPSGQGGSSLRAPAGFGALRRAQEAAFIPPPRCGRDAVEFQRVVRSKSCRPFEPSLAAKARNRST